MILTTNLGRILGQQTVRVHQRNLNMNENTNRKKVTRLRDWVPFGKQQFL